MQNQASGNLATVVEHSVVSFMDSLGSKPFPSVSEMEDSLMFSFSTMATGTEFRLSVSASCITHGKFLVELISGFFCEQKVQDGIIIQAVPLYGTYSTSHSLEGIESEEHLYSSIYAVISEAAHSHVTRVMG